MADASTGLITNAATRVFAIAELLEFILQDFGAIPLFGLKQVSKSFYNTITSSLPLRHTMLLTPKSAANRDALRAFLNHQRVQAALWPCYLQRLRRTIRLHPRQLILKCDLHMLDFVDHHQDCVNNGTVQTTASWRDVVLTRSRKRGLDLVVQEPKYFEPHKCRHPHKTSTYRCQIEKREGVEITLGQAMDRATQLMLGSPVME
ncbi:hypothetical protein Slin14017_G126110 [Septoria linicola]|nr:hypothetical protein Slin14017_G126110 [Septoria linicola]